MLALLTLLCVGLARTGPRWVSRPARGVLCGVLAVAAVVVRPPTPGWPPQDWRVVACDVGQGDALVLSTGPGEAVLVDAGPDEQAVDRCLDDLGVRRLALVVLTHFHADHVDGLLGAVEEREVGEVWTSSMLDPTGGVDLVAEVAEEEGLTVRMAPYADTWARGSVRLQVLWPREPAPVEGPGDGSAANDASVVLLAEVAGVRVLLTGDLEPPGQAALARSLPDLDVDVLKLPHHGSAAQDPEFLVALRSEAVLVSVGEGNDYGHPSAPVLDALADTGARVLRTDLDGAVAVVGEGDDWGTVTQR
jgi:competence protein ComEC